ncbi:MAG: GTP-binding protein, partial [Microgenomates group bacterium]
NIAIIAHVDHGKTTLLDGMLKQTATFAVHQKENDQTTIMDSNDLERERGVTIVAKNTAVFWKEYKINILDTPGHADFSGEVERVLNMADGCILLVDAAEGVLSQTKFVLKLALKLGLKCIVIINKVDKKNQRLVDVESEITDLFLESATDESQLDFPVLVARGIDGIVGTATKSMGDNSLEITDSDSLMPLFETIVSHIPAPTGDDTLPLQIQITSLDADQHIGALAIGRVWQGTIKKGQRISVLNPDGSKAQTAGVEYLYNYHGLQRKEIDLAGPGEIIAIAGLKSPGIGQTITNPDQTFALPSLNISEPTVKMKFSVNTSPFSGRDATYSTSRQLRDRLNKELETNVGLRMEPGDTGESLTIIGRGEMHIAVLIETMRREGYEFSVSRPQVVLKTEGDKTLEPWEQVTIEVPEEYTGAITSGMARRLAMLTNMFKLPSSVRFEYEISTANLIGFRTELMTTTSGEGILNSIFLEFRPLAQRAETSRGGAVIAQETGNATAYSIDKAQQRSQLMVSPGEEMYAGQVVALNTRSEDMVMNLTKGKKLTNMRASGSDGSVTITPAFKPSLEQFLTLISEDEMLEVTPEFLRLRKQDIVRALKR